MSGKDCTRRDFPKATGVWGVLRSGGGCHGAIQGTLRELFT